MCLLSCRLKGRDTTDQNIFVISELLMRIITHHTASTYIHIGEFVTCRVKLLRKNEHQFLGRMLPNTDKYENYQETSTSVLAPDVAEPPKSTKITTKNEHQFLCRMCWTPKSTKITRKNEHQFMSRMLLNTEKYENYQEKWTSVLGPDVVEHRKVRKLAGNIDFSSWAGCCSAKNVKKARVLL